MTNINHDKISKVEYKLALKQLGKLLASSRGPTLFLNELLTESESIMLTKRYAAIIMLEHGHSPYRVCDTVAISLSTAQRLSEQYQEGKYGEILAGIKPKEKNAFLEFLEDLILAQASPRARTRMLNRALR